ncbi:MAG: HK97 family phage prohead protease [Pseudorhodoplanes sp.]|jgi:HK97 family phage prohead protease|nr:HK97 family phage prohead protease [Pseudorhodoplanes sp.]
MNERLAIEIDTKSVGEDGVFTGYASIFSNEDLGRDIVVPGAFEKSLSLRPAGKVKMLRSHDPSEPIGVWTELKEDRKGLLAKGKLILDTTKGRETYALMKAGALDALSIGYRSIKDRIDRVKGIRFLEQIDLREISVVVFPMNPRASIASVKGDDDYARAVVGAINRAQAALRGEEAARR